MMANCIFDFN